MSQVPLPPTEVSAAEISRNFGVWQDRAMTAPVIVTRHGRPRVVLISAAAYNSGRGPDMPSAEAPRRERALGSLLNHLTEGFIALDHDLRIVSVNPAFEDLTDTCTSQLAGKTLEEGFPKIQPVFQSFVQRTLMTGEVYDFEVASAIVRGRTYKVRAFPFDGGVGALILSRLEDQEQRHKQATLEARLQGSLALPGVCWATVNLRGLFVEASPGFVNLIGFTTADLAAVQLVQLMRPASRHPVAQALEVCIERKTTTAVEAALLSRGMTETRIHLALSPVVHDGVVGAVSMVLTPAIAAGEQS